MGRTSLDLTGFRSGDLEFLHPSGRTPKGAVTWECLCHRCGQKCQIVGSRIKDPRPPKDCGCRRLEQRKDLTGQIFGAMEVLERCGNSKNGEKLYLCRCTICGKTKLLPSHTIRSIPESCGCTQYNHNRMSAMSERGVAVKFQDVGGPKRADLSAIAAEMPTRNSKTGIRGVFPDKNRGTYRCSATVAGETVTRTGFTSIETARAAREQIRQMLLEKYGLSEKSDKAE